MLTFAIFGLGSRISGVVQNFVDAAAGRARCIGYADPAPNGIGWLRTRGIDPGTAYADHAALLACERPDVVFVGSPNHLHAGHIEAALAAGCTVFSEKPVVISRAETVRMAGLIARYGSQRLHVGLVLRSSPLFRTVRRLISEGRIGQVVSMEANEHLAPGHGSFLMRDWRRSRAWAGSYLLEKCCHDFDLYNVLAGARAARVASFGGRRIFTAANRGAMTSAIGEGGRAYFEGVRGWGESGRVFDSDGDVLDHQTALVEYANGVQLAFHSNTHAVPQRRWYIAGTLGVIESDLALNRIRLQRLGGASEELTPGDGETEGHGRGHYGADAQMGKDLVATLFDGVPFPVGAEAALAAGLTCIAIDEAQRLGALVDLAPWWQELDGIRQLAAPTAVPMPMAVPIKEAAASVL